jgi:hypothetical protein
MKNEMSRRIFEPKAGSNRRPEELHSEGLHNLNSPLLITGMIKWRTMRRSIVEIRSAYKILIGMPAG